MRVFRNTMARPVGGVSFGPRGTTLVAGGSGGFDVWDVVSSAHIFVPSHAVKYLYGCIYDPAERWFYVADYLRGFRLLPLDGITALPVPGSPHECHVPSFDLTSNGERLVMTRGGAGANRVECWKVSPAGTFKALWSLCDGNPIDPDEPYYFNQAKWFTNGVAIDREGKTVALAESRSTGSSGVAPLIVLRHGTNGKQIAELGRSTTSFDSRLAFAPAGEAVYVWDKQVLERWDLRAGRRTHELPAPGRGHFQGIAVHSSGRFVVTASGDGQARYWASAGLAPIRAIKCGVGKLHSVALSRDGTMIAVGGNKGEVAVGDVEV